jgi:hypothetical protein
MTKFKEYDCVVLSATPLPASHARPIAWHETAHVRPLAEA